ncbi:hypothetical protein ABPG74_013530 [Tetrahymena malaccensis]
MQQLFQNQEIQKIKQALINAFEVNQQKKYISKKQLLRHYLQSRREQRPLSQSIKIKKNEKIDIIQNYENRKKITKEKSIIDQDQQKLLECPICMDYLVSPVQTQCGHTYCEICLTEALLKQNICPMCKKLVPNFNFVIDTLLDGLVKQYVESYNDDNKEKYIQRRKKYFAWNKKRRPQKFEEGMKVDIRDLDNIWCEAIVKKIEKAQNNEEFIFIHYIGWNSIYDEMLPSNSNRISSAGFFTQRKDIPQYRLNSQNNQNPDDPNNTGAMQGVVLLGSEGQANLEGNIDDDELMEIDEEEFQQQQQQQQQQNNSNSSNQNSKIDAIKIFQSIFNVDLNKLLQQEKK